MSTHDPHDDTMQDEGRRQHYGAFYGLHAVERTGAPLLAVLGNCQSEATRLAVSSTAEPVLDTVRIPPVHEMTADDLPHLERLLSRLDVLVVQPVKDGYRDLPLGTAQVLRRLRPGARHVLVANCFWTGLYPYQVLVRGPGISDPPIVPYHDVRLLVHAAGGPRPAPAAAGRCAEVATHSLAELQRRERAHGCLPVSDVVATAGVPGGHTVDHPGNPVLLALAARVLDALGLDEEPHDPGRELLRSVLSPVPGEVLEALGLPDEPRPGWQVDGEAVAEETVQDAHLRWYTEHPDAVTAGRRRHAGLIDRLGLTG